MNYVCYVSSKEAYVEHEHNSILVWVLQDDPLKLSETPGQDGKDV